MNEAATQPKAHLKPETRNEFLVLIFAIVFPSVLTWVYFVALKDQAPSLQQTAYFIGKTIQFLLPVVFVWFYRRKFLKANPLIPQLSNWSKFDVGGIVFGLVVVAAILAIYFAFLSGTEISNTLVEKVKTKTIGVGIDSSIKFLMLGLFYALCHSFLEEYYWRWFVFGFLKKYVSSLWANAISSLGFMAHHVIVLLVLFEDNIGLAILLASGVGVGGAVWAWLYERANGLRAPWISHLIIDAGIFSLGYLLIRPFLVG